MHTKKSILTLIVACLLAIPTVFAEGEPTNVTGVSASAAGTSSINISWNSAQNSEGGLVDHYRIYYGVRSVQGGEAFEYDTEINTPNNNTAFLLTGLSPSTTYYFSVTAIDSGNVESEEYSIETNATTQAEQGGDSIPPIVMSVVALDKTHVTIKFSEKIKLPELLPEAAFSINEQISPSNLLDVSKAEIYTQDPSGRIVLLETSEQIKNMNYVVTASVAITDLAGNPIVSGSTDSGLFAGSDKEPEPLPAPEEEEEEIMDTEEEESTEQPTESTGFSNPETVLCGEINTDTPGSDTESVLGCFETKFQTCAPAAIIETTGTGVNQVSYQYEITATAPGACRIVSKYLKHLNPEWTGKEMTCEYNNQKTFAESKREVLDSFALPEKLGNCSGELYSLLLASATSEVVVDTTPPENITNLILTFKQQLDNFMVVMNWTASINSAKDLIDQVLYQSADRGVTYNAGESLGANTISKQVNNLQAGKEYTFKITTKDAAGNESVGVVKSIRLPQTGVGAGFLLFGSLLGARAALRRKKQRK